MGIGGLFVFLIVLAFIVVKCVLDSIKTTKRCTDVFIKGRRLYGTVVGYKDGDGNFYDDNSKDCIYDGTESTDTTYVTAVLEVNDGGMMRRVEIDSYGEVDDSVNGERMLSDRYEIGCTVYFYEYNEIARFSDDKALYNIKDR